LPPTSWALKRVDDRRQFSGKKKQKIPGEKKFKVRIDDQRAYTSIIGTEKTTAPERKKGELRAGEGF